MAPLAIGAVVLGGLPYAVAIAIISALAAWELTRLLTGNGFALALWPLIGAGLVGAAAVAVGDIRLALMVLAAFVVIAGLVGAATRAGEGRAGGGSMAESALHIGLAALYVGLAALALVALRGGDAGLVAVAFVLAIVWATDIGAYFVGRALGGPKLAPSISPGKTWSGALGGLAAGVGAGALVTGIGGFGVSVMTLLTGAFISIASQGGDLAESALKRRAGVKDSSHLIPGHGGVLDRIDGLVFGAIAGFAVGIAREGLSAPARGLVAW